ncbi:MAG: SUMF1/EgtB/PvdO family nonheme iron enzyme, partial [Caldilineaceae bacterium]|nr:SUMF1/EgtB/PvdO family nonheme iron enzyme [Caldilineaceae bacterium]
WTATRWVSNYDDYKNVVDNGSDGDAARSLRGGSWNVNSYNVRSAYRDRSDPNYRLNYIGFRLVMFAPGS